MNYCSEYTLPEKYKVKVDILSKRGISSLLKNHTWLQAIWQYLNNHNTIVTYINLHYEKIEADSQRLNILSELCAFLGRTPGLVSNEVLSKLEGIVSHQSKGMRITNDQRYYIRQQFELNPDGVNAIAQFEMYVRGKGILSEAGQLLLNPYTSILNLNEIYVQSKYKYTVSYKYNGNEYHNITIYSAKSMTLTSAKDTLYLRQLVVYVCLYPYLLGHAKLDAGPRNISLYLINFPKKFMAAKGKDPLVYTSSEINTGVCDMVNIAVTRSEEALKTILHELFHFYDMDFKHTHIPHESRLAAQYNINNKLDSLNLFEAYTECITSIVNIVCWTYFALPFTGDKSNANTNYELDKLGITGMFSKQIIYTMYKLAKILKLNKCQSFMDSTCQLSQTTNVASYFLFKLFLYFDLAALSAKCIDHEAPKFIDTKASMSEFINIISNGSENKVLANIMNYLLETVNFENITSARMTCVDSN
jgi:hypothetical protein